MHHIYHTEGVILGSKNWGEAGKYYHILTRDLGLVYATAEGVRKISSKLRFILQDFSYVKIDLVQGKDFWRVTSASKTDKLEGFPGNIPALRVFSRMANLLKKLLPGTEPNEPLFGNFLHGLSMLENGKTSEELRDIEAIIVLRILDNLGYIGGDDALLVLTKSPFETELILEAAKNRRKILSEINKALRETHL